MFMAPAYSRNMRAEIRKSRNGDHQTTGEDIFVKNQEASKATGIETSSNKKDNGEAYDVL